MKKTILSLIILTLVLAMVLAGCGDSNEADSSQDTSQDLIETSDSAIDSEDVQVSESKKTSTSLKPEDCLHLPKGSTVVKGWGSERDFCLAIATQDEAYCRKMIIDFDSAMWKLETWAHCFAKLRNDPSLCKIENEISGSSGITQEEHKSFCKALVKEDTDVCDELALDVLENEYNVDKEKCITNVAYYTNNPKLCEGLEGDLLTNCLFLTTKNKELKELKISQINSLTLYYNDESLCQLITNEKYIDQCMAFAKKDESLCRGGYFCEENVKYIKNYKQTIEPEFKSTLIEDCIDPHCKRRVALFKNDVEMCNKLSLDAGIYGAEWDPAVRCFCFSAILNNDNKLCEKIKEGINREEGVKECYECFETGAVP